MIGTGLRVSNRLVAATNLQLVRQQTCVATPARTPMPFAQRFVHAVVMFFGVMAVPGYISVNIKNYRKPADE